MNSEQVELLQSTWGKVVPFSETTAELFYGRLFELDPSLRPLFKTDMAEQGRKFIQLFDVAVYGLGQPETIFQDLQDLGRRHVGYAVKDEHYDTVGTALIWAMEQTLGESLTPEAKDAWTEAYALMADAMKQAASELT